MPISYSRSHSAPTSIGFNIAYQLALKNATISIHARSLAKAESAIKAMLELSPQLDTDRLKTLVVDLSDLNEVRNVARAYMEREVRLDLLINNAGF